MPTLTVTTSPGAGTITRTYSVTTPPDPGSFPIPYMRAVPSGAPGAGFQNAAWARGSVYMLGADVAGSHLSINGGVKFVPVRSGQSDSNKLRHAGIVYDDAARTFYVAYCGFGTGSGDGPSTGTGVGGNGILKATLAVDGTLSPWSVVIVQPGAWTSAGNKFQLGDTIATGSGHPRETGRLLALDTTGAGLFYRGSWDGIWRCTKTGAGLVRIWGAGNSVTGIALDPSDPTIAYVTVDIGPKKGVWKLTGIDGGTVVETGWTGSRVPYPQDVCAVKVGTQTHLFVATGAQTSATDRAWAIAYLPPGAAFATGWRDITGPDIGDDNTAAGKAFLSSGVDAIATTAGEINLTVTRSWDRGDGQGSSIWYAFGWSGSGLPAWEKPVTGTTSYKMGHPTTGTEWWFQAKQPTFMGDKPGFDCASPRFATATRIIYPGRSGVWAYDRTLNKTYPICDGTQVTYTWDVVVSRTNKLHGIFCDTDWNALRWSEGPWTPPLMGSGAANGSPSNAPCRGGMYSVEGTAVLATGGDNNTGVHTSDNPNVLSPTWVAQHSSGSNQPPSSGSANECRGAAVWGTNASGLVILAGIAASGIWRKVGSGAGGTWTKVITTSLSGQFTRARFAVSGDVVVVCDVTAGLWRSTDKGATWEPPLFTGSSTAAGMPAEYGGHVHEDKVTAARFWWASRGKLWRINSGAGPVDVTPTGASNISAVATYKKGAASWVIAHEHGTSKLWISKDGGGTWAPSLIPSLTHCTGGTVRAMNCTLDGILLFSCNGGYSLLLIDPDTAGV